MKKNLTMSLFLMFVLIIFTACSPFNNFSHLNDLPKKGGLSIILVHPSKDNMEKPEFLSNSHKFDIYRITQVYYEGIDFIYPDLNIKTAPYYVFLDSKGIVFETSDLVEAEEFFKKNANKRID